MRTTLVRPERRRGAHPLALEPAGRYPVHMKTRHLPLALLPLLAACGQDEPSVAERFNELTATVENQARAIENEAEANVTAEQRRLDAEADALQREAENAAGASAVGQANAANAAATGR